MIILKVKCFIYTVYYITQLYDLGVLIHNYCLTILLFCISRLSLLPRAQSAVNKIRGALSEFGYKVRELDLKGDVFLYFPHVQCVEDGDKLYTAQHMVFP